MFAPGFWFASRPTPLAAALRPLACVYAAMAACHGRLRARRAYYAGVPVVSVGNLTVGGAGKTPVIAWLGGYFAAQGLSVAVVSRGYGGSDTRWPVQVRPGFHTAAQVGDEPLQLARMFAGKSISVWVGRDRPAVVRRAEEAGCGLILLDDGFQRRDVARQVDILVVDGRNPWGNGLPLPAGPLREPLAARVRASFALVLDEPPEKANTFYGLPAYRLGVHALPQAVRALADRPLLAFAGIATPAKFFDTLRCNSLHVAETLAFQDHHPYTPADLAFLRKRAAQLGATLVTTAKDGAKLPPGFAEVLPITLGGPDSLDILEDIRRRLG